MNYINKLVYRLKNSKGQAYQEKRENEENWTMIEHHIHTGAKNLLDIACDIGFYSFRAAQKGLFTIGFDVLHTSIKKAREQVRKRNQDNIAFMKMSLNPTNVNTLPQFDVILCLSVYQHFCRLFDEKNSRRMVAEIFSKCEKQLFFQMPSKKNKFGSNFSCDFQNDKEKIENYVYDLFSEIGGCSVTLIGKKKEKPPTEPYRYLFLAERL